MNRTHTCTPVDTCPVVAPAGPDSVPTLPMTSSGRARPASSGGTRTGLLGCTPPESFGPAPSESRGCPPPEPTDGTRTESPCGTPGLGGAPSLPGAGGAPSLGARFATGTPPTATAAPLPLRGCSTARSADRPRTRRPPLPPVPERRPKRHRRNARHGCRIPHSPAPPA